MDARQDSREVIARRVQQAGAGPDPVIGLSRVEFVKQHGLDRPPSRRAATAAISGEPSVERTTNPAASIAAE
jgi:hypothetical protein